MRHSLYGPQGDGLQGLLGFIIAVEKFQIIVKKGIINLLVDL